MLQQLRISNVRFRAASAPTKAEQIRDRAAAHGREQLAQAVELAARKARFALDRTQIYTALQRGDLLVADLISQTFATELKAALAPTLLEVLGASGSQHAQRARNSGLRTAIAGVNVFFDRTNPLAVAWAATRSAEQVTKISQQTRAALQAALVEAFVDGTPPLELAQQILPLIGLTERYGLAVRHLRAALWAHPGGKVWAGKLPIRVPADVTAAFVKQAADAYGQRLLKARARAIARTETLAASNEGQRQLWLQANQQGFLDLGVKRTPLIHPRACQEICQPLRGQIRGLSEPFETPDGVEVMSPPFHPHCTCAQRLATQADLQTLASIYGTPGTPEYAHNYYMAHRRGGKSSIPPTLVPSAPGAVPAPSAAAPASWEKSRRFASKAEADVWGAESQKGWAAGLSLEQEVAIHAYTVSVGVNTKLRGKQDLGDTVSWNGRVQLSDRQTVAHLDAVFAGPHARLHEKVTTHRMWSNPPPSVKNARAGDIITDRGFTSTALSRKEIGEYRSSKNAMAVMIHAKAGTKAIYLGTKPAGREWFAESSELLFNRGTSYKVVGSATDGTTLVLEVVD